jgi:hypothetical protein
LLAVAGWLCGLRLANRVTEINEIIAKLRNIYDRRRSGAEIAE